VGIGCIRPHLRPGCVQDEEEGKQLVHTHQALQLMWISIPVSVPRYAEAAPGGCCISLPWVVCVGSTWPCAAGRCTRSAVSAAVIPVGAWCMLWCVCRGNMGAVPRAQLETWLQSHCRPLLTAVDAATMLDLLLQHTYGERSGCRAQQCNTTAARFHDSRAAWVLLRQACGGFC